MLLWKIRWQDPDSGVCKIQMVMHCTLEDPFLSPRGSVCKIQRVDLGTICHQKDGRHLLRKATAVREGKSSVSLILACPASIHVHHRELSLCPDGSGTGPEGCCSAFRCARYVLCSDALAH
jgi:hypothetical protein